MGRAYPFWIGGSATSDFRERAGRRCDRVRNPAGWEADVSRAQPADIILGRSHSVACSRHRKAVVVKMAATHRPKRDRGSLYRLGGQVLVPSTFTARATTRIAMA